MKESKSKCIFSCDIKKVSFYPFLLPILYMIFRFCKDQFINVSYPKNLKILKYNLPYLVYLYLPKLLSIIFIPIIKYKTERDSLKYNKISKQYHIMSIQENKKKMILFICLISLLEVIQENGDLLLYYYQRMGSIKWLVEKKSGLILFVPFLCYFILKIDLFNHHILALVLGFIGAFIINFCRFPLGFSRLSDFPYHLLNIFFSFILSFSFVLIKYVMKKFIISPYLFIFYNGIFNIINSFIYILLEYIIVVNLPYDSVNKDDYQGNFFTENYLGIFKLLIGQEIEFYIYFFIIFILLFFYYVISALTIYNFNPYLIIIVETCLPIDNDMIEIFYKPEVNNKEKIVPRSLFQFIGYIIIIISALILNEILILNFLGCNKNIGSNISLRRKIDVEEPFVLPKGLNNPEETEKEENCSDDDSNSGQDQ